MLAPLIIHDDRDRPGEHEVVLMLNDFSFTPPEDLRRAEEGRRHAEDGDHGDLAGGDDRYGPSRGT